MERSCHVSLRTPPATPEAPCFLRCRTISLASAAMNDAPAHRAGQIRITNAILTAGGSWRNSATLMAASPVLARVGRVAADRVRERLETRLGLCVAGHVVAEQLARSLVVDGQVQVVFGAQDDALHVGAGKQSAAARIREDGGLHQRI